MKEISKKLRKEALYLSHRCKDGNLQSAFSCIDIIWTLYDKVMNWTPQSALAEDRDYFIISKGQATLALYTVLAAKKLFNLDELLSEIGSFNSRYCIQADMTKFQGGIENSAGSLGHGLPFAAGIAYANKLKNVSSKVYVLCGDGEFCEGTMWEACIFATTKELDNLCIIIDDNSSIGTMVSMPNLDRRLEISGFDVYNVDGHDMDEMEKTFLESASKINGRPKVVAAHTIRGYGSITMMENDVWFHKAPNIKELEKLLKEVALF